VAVVRHFDVRGFYGYLPQKLHKAIKSDRRLMGPAPEGFLFLQGRGARPYRTDEKYLRQRQVGK